MWAVDTNILVRHYTQDDPKQSRLATNWLERHAPCFVSLTVVLEFYWVLESAYELPTQQVLTVIADLVHSPAFEVESRLTIQKALAIAQQGIEFSDALHWASSTACEGFASFDDRGFVRKAKRLGLKPVVALPSAINR